MSQNRTHQPWYAYLFFILAGATGGMDGPFTQLLHTSNPFLRIAWKFQGVLVFFLLFFIVRLIANRCSIRHEFSTWNMSLKVNLQLLVASFGLIGMQSFLTWGATFTIMSHANLYSSLTSLLVVTFRFVTCRPLSRFEIVGCIVAIFGCAITTWDSDASKTDVLSNNILLGNFLSFISSLFATVYILVGQEVSLHIDPFQYFIMLNLYTSMIFVFVCPVLFSDHFTFNTNCDTGVFGWLLPEFFVYAFFVVSLVNGVGVILMQYLVFQFFTPVVAGTMMLQEPIFSQFFGIMMGLDQYPGAITYIGGFTVIIGLLILLFYEQKY